uniref:BTB domain-containing protein n=1 Tax=Meloidogyne hapla TaxID=6305 RepID=A0A1I8BVC2_MELHA
MKTIKFKFDWTINDIKKIQEHLPACKPLQLTSESFSSPDFPTVAWELRIELTKGSNYIHVWLRQIGPNSLKDFVNTKSTHRFENQEKMGFTNVYLNKIISHGNLNLWCEVEINCYNSIDNFKKTYQNIFEKGIFTDCVIKVEDEVIKAHRCVLAQNSEVFQKMFEENDVLDVQNDEITISNFTPECVRTMMEFFYTGEIDKTILENNVDDIFAIAHKYRVEPLKYECELFLSSKIERDWIGKPQLPGQMGLPVTCMGGPPDGKNILKYCNFICLYNAEILEKACKNYIRTNKNWFLNSKEWEEVKNAYPKLAFKFLELGYLDTGINNNLYNRY